MVAELGEIVNKTPYPSSSSLLGWCTVISVSWIHCSYPFDRVYLIMRHCHYVSNCRIISFLLVRRSRAFMIFFSDVTRNLYNITVLVTSDLSGGNRNITWYGSKSLLRGTLSVSSDWQFFVRFSPHKIHERKGSATLWSLCFIYRTPKYWVTGGRELCSVLNIVGLM